MDPVSDEEDEWLNETPLFSEGVTLLKPLVVKFRGRHHQIINNLMSIVKDHGKTKQRQEASGFSKVILPDDQNQSPDEDEEED